MINSGEKMSGLLFRFYYEMIHTSPPTQNVLIETEVDCSHFTHEIYHRLGIDFPYVSTSVMKCLNNFKEVSESEAKLGDLVLYKSHVGILDKDEIVISATKGGLRRRSTLKITDPDFLPSITKYKIRTFGPFRLLRWSCK
jgi:cell wall-associated NlpC family hydrolase